MMNIRPPNLNVNEMLKARHGSSARGMDITADTSYPRTEMSALMQSPCRPEENGYFGATYGIPSKLYYEFEIESRRGTDLSQAILVVEEHLMDVVLAVTFPTICSYEGDGRPPAKKDQDVVITGFRFGREELDLSRTCAPLEDKANYCNKFAGQVHVFGNDVENTVQYAKSVIHFALSGALPQVLGLGVQRLETAIITTEDPNGGNGSSDILPFPLAIMCGLVFSGVCVVLGIILLVLYVRKDKVRHQKLHKTAQETMMDSFSGSFQFFTPDGKHIDEADASYATDISSVKIDFEKGTVDKVPSDNIDVKFDLDYASSSCGSTVSSNNGDPEWVLNRNSSETMSHPPHYLDENGRYFD